MSKFALQLALVLSVIVGLAVRAVAAPTTAPAVTRVAFSLPPGYAGETKALDNGGWAGGWTSPENVNLLVSLAPRPSAGPLKLEAAVKASVPMMIARPCPGMKIGDTPVTADLGGHPFLGRPLTGTDKKGPQAGVAGLADVGDSTLSVIAYGPQKAFEAAWPELTAALGKMKVTRPTPGVSPGQTATTRPTVVSTPIGTGAPTTLPAGQAITFGHFIFTPPAGWAVKQDEKKVVLTPPGGKPGNPVALLTLLPPVPGRGATLPDWLEAFTAAVHKDLTVRQKREAKTAEGPGGGGVISQVVVVQPKNANRVEYRVYAAMAAGDDVQPLLLASPDATEFQNQLPALKAMIETAKPVNPTPPK